jgi:putative glutamine amidotransferase
MTLMRERRSEKMTPVIGITPSSQVEKLAHGTFLRYVLSAPYVRAIEAAGGLPIVLPPQRDTSALFDLIDGLLLSGGPDIEPSRYGDAWVHDATYGIDPERDQFELDLFDAAIARGIPVFGICRGIQVINVALGGTLIQDVASQHAGAAEIGHRQHERGLVDHAVGHNVSAPEPGLLPIFSGDGLGVNSFHHQAILELAPDLAPVAWSPDGLVEAVVRPGNCTVFGVQWHPELMFERHTEHLRPFQYLVAAATARKLAAV